MDSHRRGLNACVGKVGWVPRVVHARSMFRPLCLHRIGDCASRAPGVNDLDDIAMAVGDSAGRREDVLKPWANGPTSASRFDPLVTS